MPGIYVIVLHNCALKVPKTLELSCHIKLKLLHYSYKKHFDINNGLHSHLYV